jgi:hypothetical protein
MNDPEIIIEVAKLDGFFEDEKFISPGGFLQGVRIIGDDAGYERVPDYLKSRDAIIPVIEKICGQDCDKRKSFGMSLLCQLYPMGGDYSSLCVEDVNFSLIVATARQLCVALLKATGKWRES